MNPLDVLKPNYLSDILINRGVDELVQNRGLGVKEISPTNQQATIQHRESSNPSVVKDKLRIAKARQFGLTKEKVGF